MCALAYARAQKLPLFSGTGSRTFLQDIYLYTDNSLFVIFYRDRYLQERLGREPLRRFQDVSWSLLFQILYLFYSCCLLSLRDFILCIQNPDIESYIDKSATTWLLFIGWSLATLAQFISLLSLLHGYLISFLFLLVLSLRSSFLSSIAFFFLFYPLVCARQVKAKSVFWIQEKRSVGQPKRGVLKDLGYSLQ